MLIDLINKERSGMKEVKLANFVAELTQFVAILFIYNTPVRVSSYPKES